MTLTYIGETGMTRSRLYQLEISTLESDLMGRELAREVIRVAAETLAAEYLEQHGSEVLASLNPEAIANMAIAEAGAAVNDTLKKQHAERVQYVPVAGAREIYQRGIFGGLRRVR